MERVAAVEPDGSRTAVESDIWVTDLIGVDR